MKNHYRAVVIGGGVIGASVLYHLAKLGWKDIVLIERKELTAGSTWHAAGGFHPLNNDINISSLQRLHHQSLQGYSTRKRTGYQYGSKREHHSRSKS